jgi:hypothetical protein
MVGVRILSQLHLAMLAEQLVTIPAFEGLVWEVTAHDAKDFFRHFPLQFVLDLVHLNVQLRNWLRAHDSVYGLVADDHVEALSRSLVLEMVPWIPRLLP